MTSWFDKRAVVVGVLLGLSAGVGAFTFGYAEGFSYFSSDPAACANCHIMEEQYASWQKGPHHAAALCVDCHLPHDIVGKLLAKGSNGYHHSKGFTLQEFHEPIMIKPGNSQILQDNCVRCHDDLVHGMLAGGDDEQRCVHCHRQAGHGARGA